MNNLVGGAMTIGKSSAVLGEQLKAPDVSEIDRETSAAFAALGFLEERIQVLQRRLDPVLTPVCAGKAACAGGASPAEPLSPVSMTIRQFTLRADAAGSTLNDLLNQLALA